MEEIIIFILGMNAGVSFLFIINKTIREEKKTIKKLKELEKPL